MPEACECLILIFEDLHWIDEQTQELLNLLADSIATAKFLLLVNYRPEYLHQWNSKTYYADQSPTFSSAGRTQLTMFCRGPFPSQRLRRPKQSTNISPERLPRRLALFRLPRRARTIC
jgi:hypothetical protein